MAEMLPASMRSISRLLSLLVAGTLLCVASCAAPLANADSGARQSQDGLAERGIRLAAALKANNFAQVVRLFKEGYPIDRPMLKGSAVHPVTGTPLLCAIVFRCSRRIVRFLVDRGADLHLYQDDLGNDYMARPMDFAAQYSSVDVLRLLRQSGGGVEERDSVGWTPLMIACRHPYDVDAKVAYLLSCHARVNVHGVNGDTPLMLAAFMGYARAAEMLLRAGAHVEAANHEGITPLMRAAQRWQPTMIRLLLRWGARVNRKDFEGRTPLVWTFSMMHDDTKSRCYDTIKALVDAGANIRQDNGFGHTVYFMALQERNYVDPRIFPLLNPFLPHRSSVKRLR